MQNQTPNQHPSLVYYGENTQGKSGKENSNRLTHPGSAYGEECGGELVQSGSF
jgi:hypothetical protein